jgi:hypothetical protein
MKIYENMEILVTTKSFSKNITKFQGRFFLMLVLMPVARTNEPVPWTKAMELLDKRGTDISL